MSRNWLLPEAVEDVLPDAAEHIERLRRLLLDEFTRHGYQLVIPPLFEYVESLLTHSEDDLDLRTFKLVDQISGRTLGLRADITPQVARIDAHLLNRKGVARLCYCGNVLHTLPAGLTASRQPIQIGAELYGHAGIEADIEIIRLLASALSLCHVSGVRLDVGHVGIFRALALHAQLPRPLAIEVFAALQSKDSASLRELLAAYPEAQRAPFFALPDCYGDITALAAIRRQLPDLEGVRVALNELQQLAQALPDLPLSFDLSDLRGYRYHSGIVLAAYVPSCAATVALGGRYDGIGASFGRSRPATGFSLDLQSLARISSPLTKRGAILAPQASDAQLASALRQRVQELRAEGEIVIQALPDHDGTWVEAGCTHHLVWRDGVWITETLTH